MCRLQRFEKKKMCTLSVCECMLFTVCMCVRQRNSISQESGFCLWPEEKSIVCWVCVIKLKSSGAWLDLAWIGLNFLGLDWLVLFCLSSTWLDYSFFRTVPCTQNGSFNCLKWFCLYSEDTATTISVCNNRNIANGFQMRQYFAASNLISTWQNRVNNFCERNHETSMWFSLIADNSFINSSALNWINWILFESMLPLHHSTHSAC